MRCVTRHQLTAAEKRALASADFTVTRYAPDGECAEIRSLTPEGAANQGAG